MDLLQLSCPDCGASLELTQGESEPVCSACGHAFAVSNGIIDFIPENTFYWGEIQQDLMAQINAQAEQGDWLEALITHLGGKHERIVDYILDPVRYASLFHFYDAAQSETCLDLGSGWGPISFGLARFFKRVYSVDGVYERLRFQSTRAAQSGIQNITFLRSTMLRLPIPDSSIDVAIVNGLLEWIGLSASDISPRELQERFLSEVRRVLKPQGRLMIGIENRFGMQYFNGHPDHSGLRYTSVLPRKLANLVVRKFKRNEADFVYSGAEDSYRTLTYSYWGYQSLLKKMGYQDPEIYWAWPSYSHPHAAGTLDGNSIRHYLQNLVDSVDSKLFQTAIRLARWLPDGLMGTAVRLFAPHFLIIAHKEQPASRLQDALLGEQRQSFVRVTQGASLEYQTTFYFLHPDKPARLVGVQEDGLAEGKSRLVTSRALSMQGRMIHQDSPADARLAGAWLAEFQRNSQQGVWRLEELTAEIDSLCAALQQHDRQDHTLSNLLDSFRLSFSEQAASLPLPRVSEHGDFSPVNMLVDSSGSLQVLDWGHSLPKGQPMLDLGSFYLSLLRSASGSLKGGAFSKSRTPQVEAFLNAYLEKMQLTQAVQLAPAYYLLRRIAGSLQSGKRRAESYPYLKGWLKYLPAALQLAKQPWLVPPVTAEQLEARFVPVQHHKHPG